MKKAQVTAFILLGMVILGVFGGVIYITNYISNLQLQKKVDAIVADIIQNTPINFYVTECLDNSLKDGLYLIGRQGGFIFPYQKGAFLDEGWYRESYLDNSFLFYNNFNITYLIQNIDLRFPNNNDVPYYPCRGPDRSSDNPCKFRYPPEQLYYYGSNILFYGDFNYYTLLKKERSPWTGVSTQEQLEHFITLGIRFCTNFTAIGERLGYNITEGDITTNVTFGIEDISAKVRFPLVITVGGHEPITRMFDFFGKEDVRLGLIYKILRILIDPEPGTNSDQTNLTFNITKEFERINRSVINTGGIFFKIDKNILDLNPELHYNDIIILNDTFSRLGGNDFYIFQFARQNRMPSLDYICDDPNNPLECPIQSPPRSGIEYDFTVPFGHPIRIKPEAYDPDEDPLLFNYSGWLETRFEYWNDTKFDNESNNCTWFPQNCVEVVDTEPHIWTSSNDGWELGFQVNYTTQERDIGVHNLTVSVRDYESVPGYSDWQTLRILVVDHPIADADNSNNDYADINKSYASIEDVYWLDASASRGRFCRPWRYTWRDDSEEQDPLFDDIGISRVGLPYPPWFPESRFFNISDMTGVFNNYTDPLTGESPKLHKINLSISQTGCGGQLQLVDTDTIDVNVTLCLPHESTAAPYPYHNIPENPLFTPYSEITDDQFQGDHVCCSDVPGDWGTYNDAATECYRFEAYTCKPDVGKEYYPADNTVTDDRVTQAVLSNAYAFISSVDFDGPVTKDKIAILSPSDIYPSDNDVYYREFVQKCSGFRGNACSGVFTDYFSIATPCSDFLDFGQDERCVGPCETRTGCNFDPGIAEESCNFTISSDCYDYASRESFEFSYLKLSWADGICNNHWKLSHNDTPAGYNAADGEFLCQAACNSGGLCNLPINCKRIDDYDYKIPIVDTPWYILGGNPSNYVATVQVVDNIWGYTGGDERSAPSVDNKYDTAIPPPLPEITKTWCDGECFSYEGEEITSPTVPGPTTGFDTCTARNYTPKRISEQSDVNDSIDFEYVDIDANQTWCEACSIYAFVNQSTQWIEAGEDSFGEYLLAGDSGCCGDDTDEHSNTCLDGYNAYSSTGCDQTVCCSNAEDCVDTSGQCIEDDICADFGGIGRMAYCKEGNWTDPDESNRACDECNFYWVTGDAGEEYDPIDQEEIGGGDCCGDDPGESWDTESSGQGCCCDGSRIAHTGPPVAFCNIVGVHDWCLDGYYCVDDDVYDEDPPFGNPGLLCGCTSDAAQNGYECELGTDANEIPDGICVTDDSDEFCDSDEVCLDGGFYKNDCTSCSVKSDCVSDIGTSGYPFTKEGLCVGTVLESNCCDEWASGDAGSPTLCTSDEGDACGAGTNTWHCDDLSDDKEWHAYEEDYRCDGSENNCIKCDLSTGVELLGSDQYTSPTPNTCESGCGAVASADEETPNECSTTPGYVDGSCTHHGNPDDRQESCGCIEDGGDLNTPLWDSANKCCNDAGDDWLFFGNVKACDDGILKACAVVCEPIDIGVVTYYCDGTYWVEEPIAGLGLQCGNGICAISGPGTYVCCGDDAGEDIVYNSSNERFYCSCAAGYGGYGCENVGTRTAGPFVQNGLCASSDGSSWDCDTLAPVVNYSTAALSYFDTECTGLYGYGCDTSLTDALPFISEGACVEGYGCCISGLAIDSDGSNGPDVCDGACSDYAAFPGTDNYCDDASDGYWDGANRECDNTGDACVTCDYDTGKDDSGNCEVVCNAEPLCDELPSGYTERCDLTGEDYFEDVCATNCDSIDDDGSVCKTTGTGCNGPSECDGATPGTPICDNNKYMGVCDSVCSFSAGDSLCDPVNCGAFSNCDNQLPGYSWDSAPLVPGIHHDNIGCGKSCEEVPCGLYAFDTVNNECYSEVVPDGTYCHIESDWDLVTGRCVE